MAFNPANTTDSGSPALSGIAMFLQAFGQTYNDQRNKELELAKKKIDIKNNALEEQKAYGLRGYKSVRQEEIDSGNYEPEQLKKIIRSAYGGDEGIYGYMPPTKQYKADVDKYDSTIQRYRKDLATTQEDPMVPKSVKTAIAKIGNIDDPQKILEFAKSETNPIWETFGVKKIDTAENKSGSMFSKHTPIMKYDPVEVGKIKETLRTVAAMRKYEKALGQIMQRDILGGNEEVDNVEGNTELDQFFIK